MKFWVNIYSLSRIYNNKGRFKINPKKVQGIMDLGRPTTTTEARALIGMVQYYRDICIRRSQILFLLTESTSGPKGRTISCNYALENYLKGLKLIVYAETFLSDTY